MKKIAVAALMLGVTVAVLFSVKNYLIEKKTVQVAGIVSREKRAFLEDSTVRDVLALHYGIRLCLLSPYSPAAVYGKTDFTWHDFAGLSHARNAMSRRKPLKSETLFYTVLVLFTGRAMDFLLPAEDKTSPHEKTYINIQKISGDYMKRAFRCGNAEKGKPCIMITDPRYHGSGYHFLASAKKGKIAENAKGGKGQTFFPGEFHYLDEKGLMDTFLATRHGMRVLMAGYEHVAIEFFIQRQELSSLIKNEIRILYPERPLVIATPVAVYSRRALLLLDALKDERIGRVAWHRYGFRIMGRKKQEKGDASDSLRLPLGLSEAR